MVCQANLHAYFNMYSYLYSTHIDHVFCECILDNWLHICYNIRMVDSTTYGYADSSPVRGRVRKRVRIRINDTRWATLSHTRTSDAHQHSIDPVYTDEFTRYAQRLRTHSNTDTRPVDLITCRRKRKSTPRREKVAYTEAAWDKKQAVHRFSKHMDTLDTLPVCQCSSTAPEDVFSVFDM